jgi:hypothetical protein
LAAIAVLPEFPLLSRAVVLGPAIALVFLFVWLHRQMNSTKIFLDGDVTRGVLPKALPSMVSALIVALITGLLAWARALSL